VWHATPTHAVANVRGDLPEPLSRPRPYTDTFAWRTLKHLVQAALVASVLFLVIAGGRAPVTSLSWCASALLMMFVVVMSDRQRFAERDPAFEIMEYVAPARPLEGHVAAPAPGPLVPLVGEMHVVMPARVSVT
jgi:hypothetical protein